MGTEDIVRLISELGLPVAISLGLAFVLYRVIMWLLKDVVESTLKRFDTKHKILSEKMDHNIDKTERCEKKLTEIKSDLKVYVDLTMKGK